MRIVIDLQGAQTTGSRNRGIGRYSTALALSMIRHRGEHDIHLVLNGAFPKAVEEIRKEFGELLPEDRIHVFEPLPNIAHNVTGSHARRRASEDLRELFIRSLRPDIVHVSSLFEALIDDSVCSIGKLYTDIPVAVTLFDLIPLIHSDSYLRDPLVAGWYANRINNLRRADACLAISESARQEAIEYLGFAPDAATNVSTAADPQFRELRISAAQKSRLCNLYGLERPFVMYTGGIDLRKNIERLIAAFAKLPAAVRKQHQLAIVCSVADAEKQRLLALAQSLGLAEGDLVMTGYVPEDHLIKLYNLAELFVFPSWHEGFGLPALEAMHCGAPVIASNRSSIPEVVGLDEALFDPFDEQDIADHIRRGLEDKAFRKKLLDNAARQAKKFSWDESGRRAIAALERAREDFAPVRTPASVHRPRLAFVSPMPPARTGIADYAAELLQALDLHYEIDVVVEDSAVGRVDYSLCPEAIGVIGASEFRSKWRDYDRILYQIGNSEFHGYMIPLLEETSGVVVLHDFFISGALSYRQWHNFEPGAWVKELYRSHSYAAAAEAGKAEDPFDIVWEYPCSYSVIANAQHVIVHSEYSRNQARAWYGEAAADKLTVIPHLREPEHKEPDREGARERIGISPDDILVCAFGLLGESKCNDKLVEAWASSKLAADPKCKLVFVGENEAGQYGKRLVRAISEIPRENSVTITGWADRSTFEDYLQASDIAVQLRTRSRGETSGTVLDCMSRGVPLIVNADGSMAEVAKDAAIILPKAFSTGDLVEALETLRDDPEKRAALGRNGREIVKRDHSPEQCAAAYQAVLEDAARENSVLGNLAGDMARLSLSDEEIALASRQAGRLSSDPRPRLLIDITVLAQTDAQTGIQRVVRNILDQLLNGSVNQYRVEPVYVDPEARSFRFARRFVSGFMDLGLADIEDEIVDIAPQDTLLFLDLNPALLNFVTEEIARARRQGTATVFVVYDLLPVQFPEMFPDEAEALHRRWLSWVSEATAAVCISETVASELRAYLDDEAPKSGVRVSWFPLGTGLRAPAAAEPISNALAKKLAFDLDKPTFLAVGTIEPRKGYDELIDAFETLWRDGEEVNLCIVGREGWKAGSIVERLRGLQEEGKPIAWLDDATDEELEQVYGAAQCVIAASYGEGFGLPLVEGALRGLPLIARDIPVFREVCGEGAAYFSEDLAACVKRWLRDSKAGKARPSSAVALTDWAQSAEGLLREALGTHLSGNRGDHEDSDRNGRNGARRRLSGGAATGEGLHGLRRVSAH
jgi:glycosyltransferase involved in cell wall biosynthesis